MTLSLTRTAQDLSFLAKYILSCLALYSLLSDEQMVSCQGARFRAGMCLVLIVDGKVPTRSGASSSGADAIRPPAWQVLFKTSLRLHSLSIWLCLFLPSF